MNHPYCVIRRWELGIPNRDGTVPDVFRQVFGTGTLVDDPDQRVNVSLPGDGKSITIKVIPRKITVLDGAKKTTLLVIDRKDVDRVGGIVQKTHTRAGGAPLSEDELAKEVERIVSGAQVTTLRSAVNHAVKVDLIDYQCGILKIAYELAWYWLGDSFLDDPRAVTLREAIRDSTPLSQRPARPRIEGSIVLNGQDAPLSLWKDRPHAHIGLAMRTGSKIIVAVRIFDTLSGRITVSDSSHCYPDFAPGETLGQFIEIDLKSKTERQSSMSVEVVRLIGVLGNLNLESLLTFS